MIARGGAGDPEALRLTLMGFHPRLLNLLPSGEDAAARAETSPSGKHGLPA